MSLTFSLLKLVSSDGVTLDLLDGTKWGLVAGGWVPTPPPLRAGLLGAPGAVEDMDDTISLQVRGTGVGSSDAARATDAQLKFTANQLALWTMADKIARFGRGDPSAPSVVLQVCISGSTVASTGAPHQVLLLGPPALDPTQPTFVMPNSGLNAQLFATLYGEVTLRFRRRGVFCPLETAITAGTAATAPGTLVAQAGMPAITVPSATFVQIVGWSPTATPTLPSMYVIVGDGNSFVIADAVGGTTTKWTSVADAANNSRSGNVLRYTPTDTLPSTSGIMSWTVLTSYVRVAVLAVVRNASSKNFRLKAVLLGGFGAAVGGQVETPEVLIDASTPYPRVVMLGEAALRGGVQRIAWTATVDDITGGPFLDIDLFVVVDTGNEAAAVLKIDPLAIATMAPDAAGGIIIDPALTAYATPLAIINGSGGDIPLTVHGDTTILTKATTLTAVLLATGGGTVGSWRFTNQTPAVQTLTWYFRRYQSYILPV